MKNYLKIGEVSKLCNISIKTLRYYEEEKLITPVEIDFYSGYRHYDEKNIERIYGDEKYLVCVNLSKKTIRHNLDTKGKILINNYKKENIDEVLLPYESFIIEK